MTNMLEEIKQTNDKEIYQISTTQSQLDLFPKISMNNIRPQSDIEDNLEVISVTNSC